MNDSVTDKLLAFESDHIWVEENREGLLENYSDQWIAVRNGNVIASSPDFIGLVSGLSDPGHTCIEYITLESFEMVL